MSATAQHTPTPVKEAQVDHVRAEVLRKASDCCSCIHSPQALSSPSSVTGTVSSCPTADRARGSGSC